MKISRASKLLAARDARQFVRIRRRYEQFSVRGYVLAVGPTFFLLALVSDRLWYDGFECFRIADVTSIEPDPYAKFAEAALRQRGLRKPRVPKVEMSSLRELLESAGTAFPLVAVHQEALDPDICRIGKVVATNRSQVALLEIGPDAEWESDATAYSLKSITRVNFGGDYENALYLAGGPSEV